MSTYLCQCGTSISDVAFPSPNEHHVISDEDLDAITDYGVTPPTIDDDLFGERERTLIKCHTCHRLHIQDAPDVNHYTTYAGEVADEAAYVVLLEAALAQMVRNTFDGGTHHGYNEARANAEKLLKRE